MEHAAVSHTAGPPAAGSDRPWWTEADAAELAALTWELVDGLFEHRERCASCKRARAEGIPCPHVRRAIQVVVDWKRGRDLLSYARWLRRQRELLELQRDVVAFNRGAA